MWFRVDDGLHSHPKTFACSAAALGLWVVAGSWSAFARTGGVIPRHALGRLLPGAEALADELVVAGLWETAPAGAYRFHDWEDCNPSAAEARAAKDKQAAAGKLGNHRRWHLGRGQVDPSCPWCTEDRPTDRVPDRSTDRGRESGAESPRHRPDAEHVPAGAGASIGSDRVTTPETIGAAAGAPADRREPGAAPDRVPDGHPESGANPPSRPVPSRPTPVPPTSVGGVGEAAPSADAHGQTDHAESAKPRSGQKRGTRLPEPFEVTDRMREWAAEKAPSCGWEDHASFLDYWRGVPGAKGTKLDWPGTWRNWMRKEHQARTRGGSSRSSTTRTTTSERVEGWLDLGAQDTPPAAQMTLDATEVQEVTGWSAA
ncbi:hypothetical protein [Nocardiopsis sp. HUAS JQ3]|uniref:hypothetical protein n=1 Tax=Nocardiopsis sp. HUAS JQ3 TaxID=3061629 RepID=UPI0023A9CB5E|nr:hypothetical protein [Nocardiopsis sp. HUAS JQ3]WDZ91164.1 hypothetical protein PV789_00880 [Nocardiopsis sp. HUAS JQ3]